MKRFPIYFLLLFSQLAMATTYKASSAQEFKNILPKLKPGDELLIANGNYSNWAVDISTTGTAQRPIIIRATTEGQVVFAGDVNQTLFKLTGAYTILSGISFKDCQLLKGEGSNGVLVELKNSSNCQVRSCSFEYNRAKAQFMPLVIISGNGSANSIENCSFISNIDNQEVQVKITKESCPLLSRIENNLFRDKAKVSWKNGNGGECIQIGQDPVLLGTKEAKSRVTNNHFIRCNGESEVISNKSSGNSYLKNHFENNDGELVMRGGHDCLIADNVFEGGTGGIRVNGTGHIIANNKIKGIKTAIRLMYGMAKGKDEIGFYIAASNCTIKDNQIIDANTGILIGDSKNVDWTGKFDTQRYPSAVVQNVAPFDNQLSGNSFVRTRNEVINNL